MVFKFSTQLFGKGVTVRYWHGVDSSNRSFCTLSSDKPVQKESLREKMAAFREQTGKTDKAGMGKTKEREEVL